MEGSSRNWIRIVLFLLGVALILGLASGIVWFFLRQARTAALQPGVEVDLSSLEKTALGFYLNLRKDEIEARASVDASRVPFSVEPGESAATIATRLERMQLIADAELFRLLLRYWGVDARLEAGDYELRRNMSMSEIVTELQHGRLRARTVTIREGLRAEEIAHLLATEGLVDQEEFIHLVRNDSFHYDFLRDRPANAPKTLEGFLFPDTYQFPANITTTAVIDMLLHNFDNRVTLEMRQRALDQGLNLYQVLVIASIVERETAQADERPIIASVYLNRLRKGMYLEADVTVQYAKGYDLQAGRWWPVLSVEELRTIDSPYNTYLNPGLPPAPICSPGLASIQAVLDPADTKYLFFLTKGDGSHAFAETFEEHLENQSKYR